MSVIKDMLSSLTNSAYGGLTGAAERLLDPSGASMRYNSAQAEIDRQFAASEAQKSRDWSERMSNTAYQRAAADMRAAGLNPYAVYGGAAAAATPAAAQASSSGARSSASSRGLVADFINSAFNMIGNFANSAMNSVRFI